MTQKITLATVKRFIKQHGAALQIATHSRFSGMTDGVESCAERGFSPVTTPIVCDKPFRPAAGEPDHYLGIAGAWFVFESRDHFEAYDDGKFAGIQVNNCCGRFVLAVPKAPAPSPLLDKLVAKIAEEVTHPAKQPRIVREQIPLAVKPVPAESMPAGLLVQVYLRNVYGNTLIYPSNVLAGQLVAFAGVKTFTLTHIHQLRAMGFIIEQLPDHQASAIAQVTGNSFGKALQ